MFFYLELDHPSCTATSLKDTLVYVLDFLLSYNSKEIKHIVKN